jgi:polyhydroxyalkanoate synthesis repressor PhaR
MRHIKKYNNRKLYDTSTSKYVNLDEVKTLILEGHNVVIEDRETGADITAETLARILAEVTVKEIQVSSALIKQVILSIYNNSVDTKQQTNYTN